MQAKGGLKNVQLPMHDRRAVNNAAQLVASAIGDNLLKAASSNRKPNGNSGEDSTGAR
jgi:hypothetical protein